MRTTCNRDCPDACGMLADVEDGRVVALRGDPAHPVTQGFLCYRTSRFPKRQYSAERLTKPLLRRGDRQVEVSLDDALDFAAERLLAIRAESGPAAILHYRSGGSLGMMKMIADRFFAAFGPTSVKRGDICSGGGDAAQTMDFGREDSNDVFDVLRSKHILNWGKNLYVSNVHLVPIIKEARAKGAKMITIDPVRNRTAELSDHFIAVRPGGDVALGLAVLQVLFETGGIHADAERLCDHLDRLKALAMARPFHQLLTDADVSVTDVERIAAALADGPTSILVGWGMQRQALGATQVRMLDALSAVTGNLGRPGGGVSFYYKRRGAFDSSLFAKSPPRTFLEPRLGEEMLTARDPALRAIWVTAGNPVAMLPDSATVARAFEAMELSIVVDAFPTDTTRRATLVLPTTTLLEDDDLMGAYGHHWIGVSRPVIAAPDGVLTELELFQALARRVGLSDAVAGTAREWKARMLAPAAEHGVTLEALETEGAKKNPFAKEVLFADGKFDTPSGRVQLVHEIPEIRLEEQDDPAEYPLHLLSSSTEKSQSSQWAVALDGDLPATVHPDAAAGIPDGGAATLESPIGRLRVRVVHDAAQRKDVVIVPKGGHYDRGWAANALIRARTTDHGEGAAYLAARVKLTPA
ncbi:molybdopterin-dependent oxidoreductase [Myxococcota bacterium]|nr:molybdopterin-dependent oxidoreductase [Myxococcota bacterium]